MLTTTVLAISLGSASGNEPTVPVPTLVVQTGHDSVPRLLMSPTGRLVASIDGSSIAGNATIRIWNADQRRLVCSLPTETPAGAVSLRALILGEAMVWSQDDRRLAVIRDQGGLVVFDLEKCGAATQFPKALPTGGDPARVGATTESPRAPARRSRAPGYDQIFALGSNALLVRSGTALNTLRPFDSGSDSSGGPGQVQPLERASGNEALNRLHTLRATSVDGRVLLSTVLSAFGIGSAPLPAGFSPVSVEIVDGDSRVSLERFEGAPNLVDVQIPMAVLSPSGQFASLVISDDGGAWVYLFDIRGRRLLARRHLAADVERGQAGSGSPLVRGALDRQATVIAARRAIAGIMFSGDERQLFVLRPRVAGGPKDDPALETWRLPALTTANSLPLRTSAVAAGAAQVQFGMSGNALVADAGRSKLAFPVGATMGAGGIAVATRAGPDWQVRSWVGTAKGVDSVSFAEGQLLVASRLLPPAGDPTVEANPLSFGRVLGGGRQLTRWAFARGDASPIAGEPYAIDDAVSLISQDGTAWVRAVDRLGDRRSVAFTRWAAPARQWSHDLPDDPDGRPVLPRAFALSPDGAKVAVLVERHPNVQERERNLTRSIDVVAGLSQRAANERAVESIGVAGDYSRQLQEMSTKLNEEMQEALRGVDDPAKRKEIMGAYFARMREVPARLSEERKRQFEDRATDLRNRMREATADVQSGFAQVLQRRVVVLDAQSGGMLASVRLAGADPGVVPHFPTADRLVMSDGESFGLHQTSSGLTIRSAERQRGWVVAGGPESGRLAVAALRRSIVANLSAAGPASAARALPLPTDGDLLTALSRSEALVAVAVERGRVDVFRADAPGSAVLSLTLPGLHVTALAFSADDRLLAIGTQQGDVGLYATRDGSLLARLSSFSDGSWVVVDPAGRFDTNNLQENSNLHWVMPDEPLKAYPLEVLMRQYYEPRLLSRILAGERMAPVPPIASLNRAQPDVAIRRVVPSAGPVGLVDVTVETRGTLDHRGRPGGVRSLRLFRDGQLVGETVFGGAGVPGQDQTVVFRNIRLPTGSASGRVRFTSYAFNDDLVKSVTVGSDYESRLPAPAAARRAVLLAVGVDAHQGTAWNLRYAANDARRAAAVLGQTLRSTGAFSAVQSITLVAEPGGTSQATKAVILAALDVLGGKPMSSELAGVAGSSALSALTPDDALFLLFSGHGFSGSDRLFYLVPSDNGQAADLQETPDLLRRSISSDELEAKLRPIDAGTMTMIIDACRSGSATESEGFKPGPMGARGLGQLAYDKGIRILAASQAGEDAQEFQQLRHGLLTHALVNEGIAQGRADYMPVDRRIDLAEWLSFAAQRVPELHRQINEGTVDLTASGGRGVSRVQSAPFFQAPRSSLQQPVLFDFVPITRSLVVSNLVP